MEVLVEIIVDALIGGDEALILERRNGDKDEQSEFIGQIDSGHTSPTIDDLGKRRGIAVMRLSRGKRNVGDDCGGEGESVDLGWKKI